MVKFVDQTISKWLNALLGGFVEEINADSINVAMLAGKARLENLTVKPTCLQELGLPVILNKGTVGRIELDIPMSALKSKPICVTVRDVLISVSPNPQVDLKRVQLEKHMYEWNQLGVEDVAIDPQSKLGRLLAKLADNIKITVESVHLRFEDTLSQQPSWHASKATFPDRCFSMGFTLDRFVLEGCVVGPDGAWETRSVAAQLRFLNKVISIGTSARDEQVGRRRVLRAENPAGFGMYLHHGEMPLQNAEMEDWKAEMRGYIAHADFATRNSWLVGPIALTTKLSIDKHEDFAPCSSRIWSEPPVAEEDFHFVELGKSDELHVELFIRPEQVEAGSGHFLQLQWAFETVKDGIGFGVSFFPGHEEEPDEDEGEPAALLQTDAHVQWGGKGAFTPVFIQLGGTTLTFRDIQGGQEMGVASVAGAEAGAPKNSRKG